MNLKRAFGIVLREARAASGLSQESLAAEAGLDRTYISLLERGQRQPSLETIFILAVALAVSPSEIVRRVERQANKN